MEHDLTLGLSGKVAIVTGAAGDIGRKTVELLIAHGVRILAEDLNASVKTMEQSGKVVSLCADVSQEESAKKAVAAAVEHFGGLDILVNNAGKSLNKPLLETSAQEWDDIMATNARGYFLHAREAIRTMLRGGGGAIVNVASISSVVALKETVAYSSAKGAVAQLTRVVAAEYSGQGIRCNAIGAGVIETGFLGSPDSKAKFASFGHLHPIGRVGQPEEIADLIAYLVSPRASFITGSLVMADGGYTAV